MAYFSDVDIQIMELKELERVWRSFGHLQEAAAVAAQRLAIEIKHGAPVYTGKPNKWVVPGALMEGILASKNPEKSAVRGKAVYDIYFDREMNHIFQKKNSRKMWRKKLGLPSYGSPAYGRKEKTHYYYPASQEYGFRTRAGTKGIQRGAVTRVPGRYFMRDAAINYGPVFERAIENAVDRMLE